MPTRVISRTCWAILLALLVGSAAPAATVIGRDRNGSTPLVLDQNTDYVLRGVSITNVRDASALTISGRISSVSMHNSTFGQVTATAPAQGMALLASGASISSFKASDCTFFDAETQLVSFKDSHFGTVTFERCKFRNSDAFVKAIQEKQPWRITPPVTEFANIERLELLDNDFSNTLIVIAPTVKQVILRGDISGIFVQDPATQVLVMPAPRTAVAATADATRAFTHALGFMLARRD